MKERMTYIVDKMILLALAFLFLFSGGITTPVIVTVLIAVIFFSVNSTTEKKWVLYLTFVLYGLLLLRFPQMRFIFPLLLYDGILAGAFLPAALLAVFTLLTFGSAALYDLVVFLICFLTAFWLALQSRRNARMSGMIKKVRDDNVEKNIHLEERNRFLLEKQDSEIHVATLRERNRIAREIHDNVGHILTRSILQTGALLAVHKEEPLHGQLLMVKDSLDLAMNSIRESVHDLHDDSVDLRQTIREMTEPLSEDYNLRLEYDISDEVERKYKYAMIGIVKEAVANIIKHSTNDTVEIILREHSAMYQLIVWDYDEQEKDGKKDRKTKQQDKAKQKGLSGKESGIGIQNMRDRVDGLNGHLTISKECGYKVFAVFPR